MEYTGERMMPAHSDHKTFWEHIYRYRYASQYVKNKRVLDIACGEGYGAYALSKAGAAEVIGVDIDQTACDHAITKYGIDARRGDAEHIPLGDESVDVVVSFETIEHVPDPQRFVAECARVVRGGGLLIMSTPNEPVFAAEVNNPFHCSEMGEAEFKRLLNEKFANVRLFSQSPRTAAWWSPRSFTAQVNPWKHMRGYWRLANSLGPFFKDEVDSNIRSDPAAAILAAESWASSLLNPYAVRPRAAWSKEEPTYFVACCTRR